MLPTVTLVLSVGRGRRRFRFGVTEAAVDDGVSVVVDVTRGMPLDLVGYKTVLLEAVLIGDFVVLLTDDGRNGFSGFLRIAFSLTVFTSLFFNSNLYCSG